MVIGAESGGWRWRGIGGRRYNRLMPGPVRATMPASPCARQFNCFMLSLIAAFAAFAAPFAAAAQAITLDELVASVVRIKTFINPDGNSVSNLGREREGSGIVIDDNGLVLTIGYLMVEAHAAEVVTNDGKTVPASIVGYDHE